MKQTSETASEAILLDDSYSKLASTTFDTERAIFSDEALTFIRETQAKTWEKLEALHGAETGETATELKGVLGGAGGRRSRVGTGVSRHGQAGPPAQYEFFRLHRHAQA